MLVVHLSHRARDLDEVGPLDDERSRQVRLRCQRGGGGAIDGRGVELVRLEPAQQLGDGGRVALADQQPERLVAFNLNAADDHERDRREDQRAGDEHQQAEGERERADLAVAEADVPRGQFGAALGALGDLGEAEEVEAALAADRVVVDRPPAPADRREDRADRQQRQREQEKEQRHRG
jgi:hypothetical protein